MHHSDKLKIVDEIYYRFEDTDIWLKKIFAIY